MLDAGQTLVFALLIGFVISGVMSNLFQLLLPYARVKSDAVRLAVVGVILLAGPHILVRAADRSLKGGEWPFSYTAGCFALGLVWSFVLGYVVLLLAFR